MIIPNDPHQIMEPRNFIFVIRFLSERTLINHHPFLSPVFFPLLWKFSVVRQFNWELRDPRSTRVFPSRGRTREYLEHLERRLLFQRAYGQAQIIRHPSTKICQVFGSKTRRAASKPVEFLISEVIFNRYAFEADQVDFSIWHICNHVPFSMRGSKIQQFNLPTSYF